MTPTPWARPMPRNRPSRSNSLSHSISRKVSSSGKSSTRITTPAQSAPEFLRQAREGRLRQALRNRRARALRGRTSPVIAVATSQMSAQLGGEPEAQHDDADERQRAADPAAPQLDRVRRSPRPRLRRSASRPLKWSPIRRLIRAIEDGAERLRNSRLTRSSASRRFFLTIVLIATSRPLLFAQSVVPVAASNSERPAATPALEPTF